ncbi:MAG: hypothetical protein SGI73_21170 [Chloroflexota bacterium]|nr:hypothetical protein [Chloroflexota bacterium]
MRNVAPTRSLNRRANQFKTLAFVVGAAGIFALAVGILLNVVPLVAETDPSFGVYTFVRGFALFAGFALLIAGAALGVRAFTWKTDNDLALHVGRLLEPQLGDDYTLIRNISRLQIGYIDAALVGPPGVLVFRLVGQRGTLINEGDNWVRVKGRSPTGALSLAPLSFSPTKQTEIDMDKVGSYLTGLGIGDVPVYGLVVLMRSPPATVIERLINPKLPVTQLPGLWTTLQQTYLTDMRIDRAKSEAVVRALFGDIG